MDCTIYVAKTKALICASVYRFCVFVFAYAKSRFSHDAAQLLNSVNQLLFAAIYFRRPLNWMMQEQCILNAYKDIFTATNLRDFSCFRK